MLAGFVLLIKAAVIKYLLLKTKLKLTKYSGGRVTPTAKDCFHELDEDVHVVRTSEDLQHPHSVGYHAENYNIFSTESRNKKEMI
jgi:hypothetical protein